MYADYDSQVLLKRKKSRFAGPLDAFECRQILLRWSLKILQFVKIVPGIVLQSSSFSQFDHLY